MQQQRPSLMANKTGNGKRICASVYFRFSSPLGLCLRVLPLFLRLYSNLEQIAFARERTEVLLVYSFKEFK